LAVDRRDARAAAGAHDLGASAAGGSFCSTHCATAAAVAVGVAWNVVAGRGDVDRAAAAFRR